MIQAVLFDLDGTLVHSKPGIISSFMLGLKEVGVNPLPDLDSVSALIGRPLRDMVLDLGLDLPEEDVELFISAYRADYSLRCAGESSIYSGVVSGLVDLRPRKLGIVTTKRQDTAEILSRGMRLDELVDHIQGWKSGLRPKPAPDTLVVAAHALGVSFESTIMVGDTDQDILAGKAAGMLTCAVLYGYGDRCALLGAGPDCVIESFGDLLHVIDQLERDVSLDRENAG